jgi:hypothetical protein
MSKYKLILYLAILFSNGFLHGQTFSYYDVNSGKIKYIEGITGKKNKIKNGKKEGRIEQVVLEKKIEYFDENNFIPDIENSFIETNVSVKEIINSGTDKFLVLIGNYIDGLKQGEFKLYRFYPKYNEKEELASVNYINDTIEGIIKFNDYFFNQEHRNYNTGLVSVNISKNKITDQTIKTTNEGDYLVFKNNTIDSGYHKTTDYFDYHFKKLDNPGEFKLTFQNNNASDVNKKTILKVYDGNKFTQRSEVYFKEIIKNLNCDGISITQNRYTTFKIKDGKFTDFIKCYYLNDSLNYSINTQTGQIDLWTDLAIDKKIKIIDFGDYPDVRYNFLENLLSSRDFLTSEDNLSQSQYQSGYFKLTEIKNVRFLNGSVFGTKHILEWDSNEPFSIDYKIDNKILRRENWEENILGHLEKQFTNYDLNGNVLNSSMIEKKQKYLQAKQNEKLLKDAFGVKDDNAVVKCSYCKKSLVKKNGITIRTSKCQSSDILCLDNLGNPCEWTFCSMSCSNNFQCVKCSDNKLYRANCR